MDHLRFLNAKVPFSIKYGFRLRDTEKRGIFGLTDGLRVSKNLFKKKQIFQTTPRSSARACIMRCKYYISHVDFACIVTGKQTVVDDESNRQRKQHVNINIEAKKKKNPMFPKI